jgi:sugar/nucleoside kinase (ribokinase family)
MKYDLFCIGDVTIDIFLEIEERQANVFCDLDQKNCKLSLNYADKIPVKKIYRTYAAGNAANVAIGGSRLGLKTGLYSVLGDDEDGKKILRTLKKEKVSTTSLIFEKNSSNNLSVILGYRGERTILSFHQERIYSFPQIPETRWLYFTSMAPRHEIFYKELPNFIEKRKVKLAFNPGSYQLSQGLKILRALLRQTTVLILNREEAEFLFGVQKDIKTLLKKILDEGPQLAVLTDGERGSWANDGSKIYFLPSSGTLPVDKTGAGDSYTAGFLAALLYNKEIPEAMRWGTLNASSVISQIGTHNGLLKRAELEKMLLTRLDLKPEIF